MKNGSLNTIKEVIDKLSMCTGDYCYLDILRRVDIPEKEWERYYKWNDEKYSRISLFCSSEFELVLICWEKGQQSSIHDYDAHEAWVHPVRGKLREERFVVDPKTGLLEKVSNVILGTKEFSYMSGKVDIHRYTNIYENRSVSLHLYAKPVTHWNIYSEDGENVVRKEIWWDKVIA